MDEAQRNRGYDGDGEEEEYDDNYVPLEYGDAATGGAGEDQEEPDDVPNDAATGKLLMIKRNQCPMMMISAGSLSMQGTQCGSQKEKLKFDRMLEDHKKGLYPNCEDCNTKLGTTLELL